MQCGTCSYLISGYGITEGMVLLWEVVGNGSRPAYVCFGKDWIRSTIWSELIHFFKVIINIEMVEVDKEIEEQKVQAEESPKIADKSEEQEVKPTPTLYVRNLNDKVNAEGKSIWLINHVCVEMRTCLYHLFSTYGEVIQVRMRQT